jgi:hypothetical protein
VAAFVLGLTLLIGGFFVLVWGEARVNIATAIQNSPNLNDTEVEDGVPGTHTGALSFASPAVDPILSGDYGLVVRHVQTCAWVESETRKKQAVTTHYKKQWAELVPDSNAFATRGYDNKAGRLENSRAVGIRFRLGPYKLAPVTDFLNVATIAPQPGQVEGARIMDDQWAYLASDKGCNSGGGAMVGDQRIRFDVIRAGDLVTVFGTVKNGQLVPFRGQLILARGTRESLVKGLEQERSGQTWGYRAFGGILLWIALYLIISPALKLVTWIPILGTLVSGAATGITLIAALSITASFVFWGWGMTFFTRLFAGLIE